MKTVPLSNRFYYRELNPEDAQAIKKDADTAISFKGNKQKSFQPVLDLHHWKMVYFETG